MEHKEAWLEFKKCGLLWLINGLLHHMGYVIAYVYNEEELINVIPMKCEFEGFTDAVEREGSLDLSEHLERRGSERRDS